MSTMQLALSALAFPARDIWDALPATISASAFENRPSIASQFTAHMDVKQDGSDMGFPVDFINATLVYDATTLRQVQIFDLRVPKLGDDAKLMQAIYASNDTSFTDINEQCMSGGAQAGKFGDLFDWLKYASYVGPSQVAGQSCDQYSLSVTGRDEELQMCIDGDLPLEMNVTKKGQVTSLRWSEHKKTVDPDALTPPKRCSSPPKLCGDGHVAQQTIYVFHPASNYNVSGQDVADLLGDSTFLCSDKTMWVQGGYSLLSAFEITWLESFGQYANCPPDTESPTGASCSGGDDFHVGRASAMTLGHRQGQCDGDAPEFFARAGIWYSLPVNGECRGDAQPGDGSCTWKVQRRLKTIDMACLFQQHALDKVCESSTAPYSSVAMALLKALNSENAASGGCPPVEPSQKTVVV